LATSPSLIHALHRASQIAEQQFEQALGDADLTARQLHVLTAIQKHEDPSQTDIVESTGIDRSTMADLVRRLTDRGLIARKRSKEDARAYVVNLTAEGRRAVSKYAPVLARIEAELLEVLPANKRNTIIDLLTAFAEKATKKE
jgi:DNA-binding MarR family transcriptional regulator